MEKRPVRVAGVSAQSGAAVRCGARGWQRPSPGEDPAPRLPMSRTRHQRARDSNVERTWAAREPVCQATFPGAPCPPPGSPSPPDAGQQKHSELRAGCAPAASRSHPGEPPAAFAPPWDARTSCELIAIVIQGWFQLSFGASPDLTRLLPLCRATRAPVQHPSPRQPCKRHLTCWQPPAPPARCSARPANVGAHVPPPPSCSAIEGGPGALRGRRRSGMRDGL